jgi:hypothetical protein
MKLSVIVLSVGDVEMLDRCSDWYLKLGLSKSPPDNPGESYWFDTGSNTSIGVHTGLPVSEPDRIYVGLQVDDVDETYRRLSSDGFTFDGAPEDKAWGRAVSLHDPVGHTITLFQERRG